MANRQANVRESWLALAKKHRAIAIIRASTLDQGVAMAQAAAAGGFRLIEVTWTHNASPVRMVQSLRQELPHCVIGAGSILTASSLHDAIAAEISFCFTPHIDHEMLSIAQKYSLPMIAGAMTPTEIVTAWKSGAASVKVFPIAAIGNASYISSLVIPLGPIPLIPTGGVTVESAPELMAAGAIAVGLSSALFPKLEVQRQDWAAIESRSRHLLAQLSTLPSD